MTVAEATTGPRNVIVIMADDMELNDLPFFADEPIQWDHENNPKPGPPSPEISDNAGARANRRMNRVRSR